MTWGNFRRGGGPHLVRRALGALLGCALFLLAATPAAAQVAGSAPPGGVQSTAGARSVVVAPATLIKVDDLDFAKIAPAASPGTVTVNPVNSTCTTTGPILHTGVCRAASFAGMGTKNMTVRIGAANVTNLTGPGATMVLDTIRIDTSPDLQFLGNTNSNGKGIGLTTGGGNQKFKIVSSTGIFSFRIGGTLHVNANQAPGVYNGSVSITVQYQ